jgi:hypothetical protein
VSGNNRLDLGTFDDEVRVIRRSRVAFAIAAAPAVLGAGVACIGQGRGSVAVGVTLAWLAAGAVLHVWRRNPAASERRARARAEAGGLFIDGRLVLDASRVQGGWLQPRTWGPPLVRVCGRGTTRHIDLAVRDSRAGRGLLQALGIDAARVSAQYWTMARPLGEPRSHARAAAVGGLVLAFGAVGGHSTPAALALSVVALLVLVVAASIPTHVTVGTDGISIEWLGTCRFVPWASVAAVESFDRGVVLALSTGQWLTLRTPAADERHHTERDAMVERMRVAWRACAETPSDEAAGRRVRREGGRTLEWVRAVRAMATSWGGYRTVGMPTDRLWRVVEDPAADRALRTGAAIALAPSLDADGRGRLHAVASSCAEPRLRIALATAATAAAAADDELSAALDAIESEEGEDQEEFYGATGQ